MTLGEVAAQTGGWVAPEVAARKISGLASLDDANPGDLAFFGNPKYLRSLRKSRATAALVPHGFGEEVPPVRIWVDDPGAAFSKLLPLFTPPAMAFAPGVHPTAVVSSEAAIGEGVFIGPCVVVEPGARIGARSVIAAHSYIGHGVRIGEDCRIYPQVTIRERCTLANRVILHPGVVVGADGFGYEFRNGAHQKIPQTGIVQIEDDVEIGANSTVDRARFGRTWIRQGTKIDNLVQIAHNVTIGENSILCAQVGISGSTRVGSFVTLAGKVGINGHIEIGDGTIVTAMSGITKNFPPKEVLGGLPARRIKDYKIGIALLNKLPRLYDRLKKMEMRIGKSDDANNSRD
ncbi:MAG: UDP-3-O-(3-hydroxymyristoyl)glucosamine N-acyltransferase [Terrimicrobiaceae bacterium]|nr:UDP-3-O-(3-hydroxymyristoyl)glucosamine N-acyltransferase [Terrimicrobiaceae bacterium]